MNELLNTKIEIEKILNSLEFNNNLTKLVMSLSRHRIIKSRIEIVTPYIDKFYKSTKKVPKVPMSLRLYCILNNILNEETIPKCTCGKMKTFDSIEKGFKLSCGNKSCYQSLPETNRKRQQTIINRFGSLKEGYDCSSSMKREYGVENCSKLDWVKKKKKKTSRKNWGTDYPWQSKEGKQLQKEGVQNIWNVDNISQHLIIKEKKIETSQKNWGVDNPSQHISIRKKILAQNGKEYLTPSGKIFLIDGYENIALDYLYKHFDEDEIIPQPDISIPYLDKNNIKHVWFPDVQINLKPINLIEIKLLNFISTEPYLYEQISGAINKEYNSYILIIYKKELYALFLKDIINKTYSLHSLTNDDFLENVKSRLINYNFNIIN